MKGWGAKKIHEELITTLGDDAYHLWQIKTWLQRFKNGDLSCKDHSRPGRPVLTLGSQLQAFLLKYPFPSARVIARHFCTTAPTIKDILHRELGMAKFSRRWVLHFLSEAQKRRVSKHQKRCCESSKTRKKTSLTELELATSLGFDSYIRAQKCLHDRLQKSFQ
jgi:transposase